ncbi:MAG: tRNA (guanine-N(7)-)-methyltransferase [Alphaproteobacteria bacterium ADurb.Bin438]|nr:MAG: tRNA (guanine-N(7)-)-methyltransferase [Alphaproteobacteria bacterium ADurb.Bin438]
MKERIKFYGRKKGKKLKENREKLLLNFLDKVKLDPEKSFEVTDIFSQSFDKHVLEIGFGGGEHIAAQSLKNQDTGYIGAEVFINGIASLLAHLTGHEGGEALADGRVDNVRIFNDDVRLILPSFKNNCFDKVYLLFPDPWPKTRHKARRFVNHPQLDELSRIMKSGGEFIVASDDMTYIRWALFVMSERKDFDIIWTKSEEYFTQPNGWEQTRYETKALNQEKKPVYLVFRKK